MALVGQAGVGQGQPWGWGRAQDGVTLTPFSCTPWAWQQHLSAQGTVLRGAGAWGTQRDTVGTQQGQRHCIRKGLGLPGPPNAIPSVPRSLPLALVPPCPQTSRVLFLHHQSLRAHLLYPHVPSPSSVPTFLSLSLFPVPSLSQIPPDPSAPSLPSPAVSRIPRSPSLHPSPPYLCPHCPHPLCSLPCRCRGQCRQVPPKPRPKATSCRETQQGCPGTCGDRQDSQTPALGTAKTPQVPRDIPLEPPHTAVPQFPPSPAAHPAAGWIPKGNPHPTARKEGGGETSRCSHGFPGGPAATPAAPNLESGVCIPRVGPHLHPEQDCPSQRPPKPGLGVSSLLSPSPAAQGQVPPLSPPTTATGCLSPRGDTLRFPWIRGCPKPGAVGSPQTSNTPRSARGDPSAPQRSPQQGQLGPRCPRRIPALPSPFPRRKGRSRGDGAASQPAATGISTPRALGNGSQPFPRGFPPLPCHHSLPSQSPLPSRDGRAGDGGTDSLLSPSPHRPRAHPGAPREEPPH